MNTVVLIGGVAVVGFLAYKAMTTTSEDIGKSIGTGVGGVVVGVTESVASAAGTIAEGFGKDIGVICDEDCQMVKHQADVVYATRHHNAKDDVRNFMAFGAHADPNLLIKEGIANDMQTSGLEDRIKEHTLNTSGVVQIVSDTTPIVIPTNGPIPVSTSQDHAVRQEVNLETHAIADNARSQFAATVFEGDDATFWRAHAAQYCKDNSTSDHIWVGNFFNRHVLGSKVGFNNYTGSEHVTCHEYANWVDGGGHYDDKQ